MLVFNCYVKITSLLFFLITCFFGFIIRINKFASLNSIVLFCKVLYCSKLNEKNLHALHERLRLQPKRIRLPYFSSFYPHICVHQTHSHRKLAKGRV